MRQGRFWACFELISGSWASGGWGKMRSSNSIRSKIEVIVLKYRKDFLESSLEVLF